jgi:hypothetical protein
MLCPYWLLDLFAVLVYLDNHGHLLVTVLMLGHIATSIAVAAIAHKNLAAYLVTGNVSIGDFVLAAALFVGFAGLAELIIVGRGLYFKPSQQSRVWQALLSHAPTWQRVSG